MTVLSSARFLPSLVLLLICSGPSASASSTYCGKSAGGLRINQAQVLGSHNSYHLGQADGLFKYSHPPLDAQLNAGVRAFELDVFYDFGAADLKVLHVPEVDEGTSCKTLMDCLSVLKTWSNVNPYHFPFFVQLEFLGGIKSIAGEELCTKADVEEVVECAKSKCVVAVSEIQACLISKCAAEAIGAAQKKKACQSILPCLQTKFGELDQTSTLTGDVIETVLDGCVSVGGTTTSEVSISAEEMPVVAQKIKSVLDATFPSTHRIAPKDVFAEGLTESAALAVYSHSGSGNFWPTVDDSRGKVLFWLTQATWPDSHFPKSTRPFFLDGVDMSVVKADDPTGAKALVKTGVLVRTRSDVDGEPLDASRVSTALTSGALTVSSDRFPTKAVAPNGPADWPLDDAKDVWIPGGMPVRCNPVTVAAEDGCTSLMLEDPSTLSCKDMEPGTSTPVSSGKDKEPGAGTPVSFGSRLAVQSLATLLASLLLHGR